MIDCIITSKNRHDLLEQTAIALLAKEEIAWLYVFEDGEKAFYDYPTERKCVFHRPNSGQLKAIDTLMTCVTTEYYLHTEDDFCVEESGGIEEAIAILEANPDCISVSLRGNSLKAHNGHGCHLVDGVWQMDSAYLGWSGFSWAPSVRRKKDYTPYGSITTFDPKMPWVAEQKVGDYYRNLGFWCATTEKQYFAHRGEGRSTLNTQ